MSSPAERRTPDAHLIGETDDPQVRYQLLLRLRDDLDRGDRDPELLYLGARYAASLAMKQEARHFLDALDTVFDGPIAPASALRAVVDEAKPGELPATAVKRARGQLELAGKASAAYDGGDLAAARLALEDLLLIDAERADVLWNLLVVTTAQQDVPAYER